jgi:hypothetical protein
MISRKYNIRPPLQNSISHHYKRFFKEFCTQKMKANKTMRGQAAPKHRRRKDKESESNINSATNNQTLK